MRKWRTQKALRAALLHNNHNSAPVTTLQEVNLWRWGSPAAVLSVLGANLRL